MNEKKRLPEQKALYTMKRAPTSLDIGATRVRTLTEIREAQKRPVRNEQPKVKLAPASLQRVVTMPEADLSDAAQTYTKRQEQHRQARQSLPARANIRISRTLRQTGQPASNGRLKAVKVQQRLPEMAPQAIPVRSGKHRRRGWFWRLLGLGVILVILASTLYMTFNSSTFVVRTIEVKGTENTALIQAIQKLGGEGEHLFFLKEADILNKVEAIPQVASASLEKKLPDTIKITIVERAPVLIWQNVKNQAFSVDAQGKIIAPVSQTLGVDRLPVIQELHTTVTAQSDELSLQPGIEMPRALIQFGTDLLTKLPTLVGIQNFKLYYDGTIYASTTREAGGSRSKGTYIVEVPQGWKAYLGDANDANPLENRLLALREILSLAQKQQVQLEKIDLRYGLSPVYTVKP